MRKYLFLFILGIVLTFGTSVNAEEDFTLNVNSTQNSIDLDWGAKDKNNYYIYLDKELIWNGKADHYSIQNLDSDTRYDIMVIAKDDNGEIVSHKSIGIDTKKFNKQSRYMLSSDEEQNELDFVSSTTILDENKVEISWDGNIPDEDGIYEVYKDGVKFKEIKDSKFTDDIEPSNNYLYSIVGKKKLPKEKINAIKEEAKEHGIKLENDNDEDLFYQEYNFNILVDTENISKKEVEPTLSRAAASSYKFNYGFLYKTFIPECKVPNLSNIFRWVNGGQLGGDCRGTSKNPSYSFNSKKFRSISEANAIFSSSGNTLEHSRNTGRSYMYDKNGKEIANKKAPVTGITMTNKKVSSTKMTFTIKHHATIPFGIAPGIDYRYDATILKNGRLNIIGQSDKAPAHEFYIYMANTELMRPIYKARNYGFANLLPNYEQMKWKVSL